MGRHKARASRPRPRQAAALRKGNEARIARAKLKRRMREGGCDPLAVVAGDDPKQEATARDMPIESLLMAVPGIGQGTAITLLNEMGIPPATRAFGLTRERRQQIARRLEELL